MKRRHWADLSGPEKAGIIALSTVQFGLLGAALWDLGHRTADEVRGDRRMWAGLVFVNWIGPLAYFTLGRKEGLFRLSRGGSKAGEQDSCREAEPSLF